EWKKTVEAHHDFAGINPVTGKQYFTFMEKHNFRDAEKRQENAIDTALETAENVVVAFSLQDLYGSTNDTVQFAHSQVQGRVSYVLSDEAHFGNFGARAYSQALMNEAGYTTTPEDILEAEHNVFSLNPAYGRLYISATPINILIDSGFTGFFVDTNVVQVSTEDIATEARLWEQKNESKPIQEREDISASPYFGIPESFVFALNYGNIRDIMMPDSQNDEGDSAYSKERIHEITKVF